MKFHWIGLLILGLAGTAGCQGDSGPATPPPAENGGGADEGGEEGGRPRLVDFIHRHSEQGHLLRRVREQVAQTCSQRPAVNQREKAVDAGTCFSKPL